MSGKNEPAVGQYEVTGILKDGAACVVCKLCGSRIRVVLPPATPWFEIWKHVRHACAT